MTVHLLVVVKSSTKLYSHFIVIYMSSEVKVLHNVQKT